MTTQVAPSASLNLNKVGLSRNDYKGAPSTLCQGCGHNGIAAQIVAACFEMNLVPEKVVKFSGIGCSSKSPTYFLGRSFSFNGLHGRMPSLALGGMFADRTLKGFGVSGDGDTASIGIGQFKHLVRRNLPMVYIVENNGVYGLTKGQFSATAERGLMLKKQGTNPYLPVDIAMEALISNATYVARSFAGDPKQVKELLKAAIAHNGIAVLDIISPCVTFHNHENSFHSYSFGKQHEEPLHEISFVPARDEITVDDFEEGTTREVELHDGSHVILKKLEKEYDPRDRWQALRMLEEAQVNNWLITGLIYVSPETPSMFDIYNIPETPLNRTPDSKLRPSRESLDALNDKMF
ncbi:MAG: 2-oxoglutarate ferredoxin oxidoreductase subunit beta [Chloroflexi bacterium]|nr:MAG: 2-oxoglutarate ferredoxin oxidoreductase subunit beta [Chloroflexota bacterium]MBA4374688.1 2-oxoglutarate ferredoxin oxidoreductase subunit beta [Anaerolinea sp.]